MTTPISPLPTPPSPADSPVDFNTKAFALLGALPAFVTEANAQASGLDAAVLAAETEADAAALKASEALTSADSAAISKTGADSARNAAVIAKNAAEAALDSFDDRYLGAKSVEPTTDNDGGALLTGALYWDTALPGMRSWNGGAWVTLPAATAAAISNTPAGSISATTVQAAINELDSEKVAKTAVIAIAKGGTGATSANAAADAIGAFRRGTLLGTVSQSDGVPTGAVIERGSNANGEYVRFADGTQICTFTRTITGAVNSGPVDGIYYLSSAAWNFPATFVGPVVGYSDSVMPGRLVFPLGVGASTANMSPGVGAMTAIASSSITQALTAIGRWF